MVGRLLSRLTRRELEKNWFEYLSMFLITVLAVTLFLGFISNSKTFNRRAELYYERVNLADLVVQTTGLQDEDRDFLDAYGAEYRIFAEGNFRRAQGPSQTAKFYVADGAINAPYLTEGEPGVLIDARVAELNGYAVGDTVLLAFPSLNGVFASYGIKPAFEAQITGLMHSVEIVNVYSVSPVLLSPAVFQTGIVELAKEQFRNLLDAGFLTEETIESLVEGACRSLQTQALVKADDAQAAKAAIRAHFEEKGAENNLVTVYDHDTMEAVVTIDAEDEQSLKMIYVFPVIFFFVSILVIVTSASRLILRDRTQIGTMKALGISDGRIVVHYALLSALVTLFGCLVGAALGPLIVPNVMSIKYRLMFSMPFLAGIAISIPWTVGVTLVVCFAAFVIGVCASRSVIREQPAECMRPKLTHFSPGAHAKGFGGENALALGFKMALRNIRVGWRRSIMAIVGIAGCSALLLTSFGIGDTLDASVQNDYGTLFTFDVTAPCSDAVEGRLAELEADPAFAIDRIETVGTYIASARGKAAQSMDLTVTLLPAACEMASVVHGTNALSQSIAEELELSVGDVITFTVSGGQAEYTVEEIVTTSTWNAFFTTENKFDSDPISETAWIRTSEPDRVAAELNEAAGSAVAKTMEARVAEIENIIASTNAMKYTLMTFAILLSIVVLYNLSLLNMKERTRDLATMKVLGFSQFKIALSIFFEIILLTLVGMAIGCAVGYPLLHLIMTINEVSVMYYLITLRPISYVLSVVLSIVTAAGINVLFGFLVSRISMTESLKSVE